MWMVKGMTKEAFLFITQMTFHPPLFVNRYKHQFIKVYCCAFVVLVDMNKCQILPALDDIQHSERSAVVMLQGSTHILFDGIY